MRHVVPRPGCFSVLLTEYFSQDVRRRDQVVIVSSSATECDGLYFVFIIDSRRCLNSFNEGVRRDPGKKKIKKNEIFFQYSNLHERTVRPRLDGWKV